jgi:hypothetical protein
LTPPTHPLGALDPGCSGLALGAQIQVFLQQQAVELARVDLKARLKLTVRQSARVLALKPGQRRRKPLT